jgi:hypothetical protein
VKKLLHGEFGRASSVISLASLLSGQSGFHIGVRFYRTLMTRIERIDADPFLVLSAMIRSRPRHQSSIDAFFAMNANC